MDWEPEQAPSGTTFDVYRGESTPLLTDSAHRIASGLQQGQFWDDSGYEGLYYVVTAVNVSGESGPSNTAQAESPPTPTPTPTSTPTPTPTPIVRKYYYAGGQRVAMRVDDGSEDVVYYLHSDHLGSTSLG